MREKFRLMASAIVFTRRVLPRPGTPSRSACDPASMHTMTPSTTPRLPTMTFPTSSRRAEILDWKRSTSARVDFSSGSAERFDFSSDLGMGAFVGQSRGRMSWK
jgi:hypothetical protein